MTVNIFKLKILFKIVLFFCLFNLNAQSISIEDALINTALIEFGDGSSGSGVLFSDSTNLYYITAKHVIVNDLFNNEKKMIEFHLKDSIAEITFYPRDPENSKKNILKINLAELFYNGNLLLNVERDIAVLKLGFVSNLGYPHIEYYKGVNKNYYTSKISALSEGLKFDEVKLGKDIYIIGYPKSIGLLNDTVFNYSRPLLRKGIIAGKDKERMNIIVDCPAYGGNSGGPVIMVTEKGGIFIGIISKFIPFEESWINPSFGIVNKEWSNSGYSVVVPFDYIQQIIGLFKKNINSK